MREIKFRAWVNSFSHWHMTTQLSLGNNGVFFHKGQSNITKKEWRLMQYTGLKDKNGTEIYEGDIVKQEYNIVLNTDYDPISLGIIDQETDEGYHTGQVVILASKGASIKNPVRHSVSEDDPCMTNQYKPIASYRCEVIGNIFETPELLEVVG